MSFTNLPTPLQNLVQQGYLKREFEQGLTNRTAYRAAATPEPFEGRIGVTSTLSKIGRKAPATTPLSGSDRASNLNNGLTPQVAPDEQYTISIEEYGDAIPLNLSDDEVTIKSMFLKNGEINGEQAAHTMDDLAKTEIFNGYLSGDTFVTSEGTNTTTKVYVNDIRGFETAYQNGNEKPVSPANPLTVVETGAQPQEFQVTGAVRDNSNASTAAITGGWSGYLTMTTPADNAPVAGDRLVAADGSVIIRAGGRSTTAALTGSDMLKYQNVLDAAKVMDKNNIPRFKDGTFKCILDDDGAVQLQADPRIQIAFQGRYDSAEMRNGFIGRLGGVSFYRTTLAPIETNSGYQGKQTVHRAVLLGEGALLEADWKGKMPYIKRAQEWSTSDVREVNGFIMVTRGPIDVLAENITQAWKQITGFACPRDKTTDPTVTPTASNSRYKRACVIEYTG